MAPAVIAVVMIEGGINKEGSEICTHCQRMKASAAIWTRLFLNDDVSGVKELRARVGMVVATRRLTGSICRAIQTAPMPPSPICWINL